LEEALSGNGPRYDHAQAAAILILSLHLDPSLPEPVRFSRIVNEILDSMYRAEAELARARLEPSVN
jgi:hypothetical protein